MRAVDTNVLVRLLARDDPRQLRTAESFIENGAWVSILALAEAGWILASVYHLNSDQLASSIEMLLQHSSLALQDQDTIEAALVHFRAKPSLGFSDCLMLELARKAGHLPLGTFDGALGKLDGARKL